MYRFSFSSTLTIHDHVKAFHTLEAGGLLFGEDQTVVYAVPAMNEAAEPHESFTIGADNLAKHLAVFQDRGLELVGSFHSHPNGSAKLSKADVAMAAATGLLMIVAPGEPTWTWALYDPVEGGEVDFAVAPPWTIPKPV
jgi:proteasome lid subunit RPN8/RPN11